MEMRREETMRLERGKIKTEWVKRGHVYKWHEGLHDERFVLVVSGEFRGAEKVISILMFGESEKGKDVVCVANGLLGTCRYLHCGMVTYVNRQDLSEMPMFKVSEKTMSLVDRHLSIQLGITKEDVLAELKFYKAKCDEYICRLTGYSEGI